MLQKVAKNGRRGAHSDPGTENCSPKASKGVPGGSQNELKIGFGGVLGQRCRTNAPQGCLQVPPEAQNGHKIVPKWVPKWSHNSHDRELGSTTEQRDERSWPYP